MSVSSAGFNLQYSTTDIAVNAGSGWADLGCILSAERNGQTLEINEEQGCLSEAVNSPAIPVHKTAGSTNEGTVTFELEFTGADKDRINDWRLAATKIWLRAVEPDTRNSSGVLQPATCSLEKLYGWFTEIGTTYPAGGNRITCSVTFTVDTATYTPKT